MVGYSAGKTFHVIDGLSIRPSAALSLHMPSFCSPLWASASCSICGKTQTYMTSVSYLEILSFTRGSREKNQLRA